MAEKGGARFNIDKLRWADVAPLDVVEPIDGLKDTGWAPQVLPDDILNWRWQKVHEYLDSLQAAAPREFEFLADAFDLAASALEQGPVSVGDVFRVSGLGDGTTLNKPGDDLWSIPGADGGEDIIAVAADSEHVYYVQETGVNVYAVDPRDGSAVWTSFSTVANIRLMIADGAFVYAVEEDGGGDIIHLINRATGALVGSITISGASIDTISANGTELVAVYSPGTWQAWDNLGASPSSIGTDPATDLDTGIAVDDENSYLLGSPSGVGQISARVIQSPGSISWTTILPAEAGNGPRAITSDGEFVYVSMAGNTDQLICLNQEDGLLVWIVDVADDFIQLSVDDRYIWAGGFTGDGYALDKTNGRLVWSDSNEARYTTDSWGSYGTDGGINLVAKHAMRQSKDYLRAGGTDPKRTPFHALAIPVDDARQGPLPDAVFHLDAENNTPDTTTGGFPDATPYLEIDSFKCPAGRYRIAWYYEWGIGATHANMTVQIDLDAGTILANQLNMPQSGDIAQRHMNSGFAYVDLTAGVHSIAMEWGASSSTGQIHRGRLEIVRIGD